MYIVKDKEFEQVTKFPGKERYIYFIKKIVDFEELWSIRNEDGWCLAEDTQKRACVPIWPAKRYADACIADGWSNAHSERISLDEWLENWIPDIENENQLVAVFPTPNQGGVVVSPEMLREHLLEEGENY